MLEIFVESKYRVVAHILIAMLENSFGYYFVEYIKTENHLYRGLNIAFEPNDLTSRVALRFYPILPN